MEVGGGGGVNGGQGLRCAVERAETGQGPAFVGDCHERSPLRCAGAGAADRDPAVVGAERVVDRHADAGVVGDVGHFAAGEFLAHAAAAAPGLRRRWWSASRPFRW